MFQLQSQNIIFKAAQLDIRFDLSDLEQMRLDAMIANEFSSQTVSTFGHCGVHMLTEVMRTDLERLAVPWGGMEAAAPTTLVRNSIPVATKLSFALQMAMAVEALHSHTGGVIVHDDIQLSQFLLHVDGTLKLNDFNRAEIMRFDPITGTYCRYQNGRGPGVVCSTFIISSIILFLTQRMVAVEVSRRVFGPTTRRKD